MKEVFPVSGYYVMNALIFYQHMAVLAAVNFKYNGIICKQRMLDNQFGLPGIYKWRYGL